MTDEEIDERISHFLGCEKVIVHDGSHGGGFTVNWPNFANDLNLMHEAVKILTVNQWTVYLDTLYKIVQDPHICPTSHAMAYVEAEARPRAIAFLAAKAHRKEQP